MRQELNDSPELRHDIVIRIQHFLEQDTDLERMNPYDAIILCYLYALSNQMDLGMLHILESVILKENLFWSKYLARQHQNVIASLHKQS